MMNQQIPLTIRILKGSHIPTFHRLTFIEQRSLQFIFPIDRATGSIAYIWVHIT